MEKLFYSNSDIQRIYEISRTQAYRKMKDIREENPDLDIARLPRMGVLPVKMVKDYFDQSKKKKDA